MSAQTALERAQLVIESERGELVLDAGRVTLRTPALSGDGPTCVEFGVEEIRDTHLRAPSRGGRGWLHIAVVGGSPSPPGELAAVGDPYTLPLTSGATPAARRFSRLVDRHVRARGMPTGTGADEVARSTAVAITQAPQPPAVAATPPQEPVPESAQEPVQEPARAPSSGPDAATTGTDLVRELQALADLRASGALTEDEFERAKGRLLT